MNSSSHPGGLKNKELHDCKKRSELEQTGEDMFKALSQSSEKYRYTTHDFSVEDLFEDLVGRVAGFFGVSVGRVVDVLWCSLTVEDFVAKLWRKDNCLADRWWLEVHDQAATRFAKYFAERCELEGLNVRVAREAHVEYGRVDVFIETGKPIKVVRIFGENSDSGEDFLEVVVETKSGTSFNLPQCLRYLVGRNWFRRAVIPWRIQAKQYPVIKGWEHEKAVKGFMASCICTAKKVLEAIERGEIELRKPENCENNKNQNYLTSEEAEKLFSILDDVEEQLPNLTSKIFETIKERDKKNV